MDDYLGDVLIVFALLVIVALGTGAFLYLVERPQISMPLWWFIVLVIFGLAAKK